MRISGSLIEDMPKKEAFFEDIVFFEKEFDGVMPLEIMIDTQRKKGVMKLSTLRRMDELEKTIDEIPELSKPISIVNLVKYSKQAYYNGNPDYYDLPSSQEQSFILSYAKNATGYLLDNLLSSLVFAFLLTALLIAFMFRSFKMVLVSMIPNLLPLMLTAGIMGFLDIPLKPSTILVFGIAFGLSVDDTVRFLSQYREELKKNNWKIRKSVYATFNEAGLSMFYTSIVLFFGFSVFMLSSFGGTVALGGLISLTLLFGMLSNLMLLPALVLTLNKTLANKQDFIEPKIDIIEPSDAEIDDLEKNKLDN